jgi:elongation factor Ts
MANYTAGDVKTLRERSGAGMMDCKAALDEANGDLDKAMEVLRLKGLKGVTKREGRTTSNGIVIARVASGKGYLIELACETDFVAKADKFVALGDQIADAIAAAGATDVDSALAAPVAGKTVADAITDEAAIMGEKVAVHIAAFSPTYLTSADVPADIVETERRIAGETARNEGKPEAALEKIVEGRVKGFFKENCLLEQDFAKDNKVSVGKVLEQHGLTVSAFVRFRVGA